MEASRENIAIDLLIDGCREGNRASQKRLYEHFYGYALSIALRYCSHRNDAVEVINDAFYKAFSNLEKYDKDRPFRIWLRRIIINASIDYQRKYRPKFFTTPLEEVDMSIAETPVNIPESRDLLPILQKLSPKYRTVFNLYVFEGFKHDEIAERLGISSSTSRSNLLRAKAQLKKWILSDNKTSKSNAYG